MAFNTDRILLQPSDGESVPLENARWSDNLPILFQEKVIQSFENAGYARQISRTRDGTSADYQLLVDIRSFHISTSSDETAEIQFVAKILDKDGRIQDANTFQATVPVTGTGAQAYVNAIDEAFSKLQVELLKWTTGVLDMAPPPISVEPPAPEGPPSHPLL